MLRSLTIQTEPIDEPRLLRERRVSIQCGAVVCFAGIVRAEEGERSIVALEYEAFREMASHQFEIIFRNIETRWPIESIRLVHRIGLVPVNAPSLWVEATAPHRREAFEACQYLIDEMKRTVPIWKKAQPAG